jgi:hypothetical protein
LDRANERENETAAYDVTKELAKVLGQQLRVTDFVLENWSVFCYKK